MRKYKFYALTDIELWSIISHSAGAAITFAAMIFFGFYFKLTYIGVAVIVSLAMPLFNHIFYIRKIMKTVADETEYEDDEDEDDEDENE